MPAAISLSLTVPLNKHSSNTLAAMTIFAIFLLLTFFSAGIYAPRGGLCDGVVFAPPQDLGMAKQPQRQVSATGRHGDPLFGGL